LGLTTAEQRFQDVVESRGLMVRQVLLTDKWWRDATGPMLGHDKQGHPVALLPTRWGLGYSYTNQDGVRLKVNGSRAAAELDNHAMAFIKPLPAQPLTVRHLMAYALKAMPASDIAMLVLASVLVLVFGMFTPYVNKLLFDSIIPSGMVSDLWPVLALLLGAAVGIALFGVTRDLLILRLNNRVRLLLQNAIMARLFTLHPNFFWKYQSGNLSMRVGSISRFCTFFTASFVGTFLTALFSLGYFIQIIIYAPRLLMPSLAVVLLQTVIIVAYYYVSARLHKRIQDEQASLGGLRYNLFAGIQKIKSTGSERRALAKWLGQYVRSARLLYNPGVMIALLPALISFVSAIGFVLIFYVATTGHVTTSSYIAFAAAFGCVNAAFLSLAGIMPSLTEAIPLLQLSKPILESVPEQQPKSARVDHLSGNIEVSDLSFRYSADMPLVLDGISLSIKAGEYVGIVGQSGCGKSTLLRLLLGFEKPLSGGIFYDSYDLQKVNKPSLRRRIGCCLQNGSLFIGDLFQNITVTAPWSSHDDAWEALRLASIDNEVREMPMGLNTMVSEGGGSFSGGQRQRLLIARALIGKPSIVFFDEATSALDNITQKEVSDNLDKLKCTRLVIAHRLSTIRHCDRIVVLDRGHIAEEGTFEELMSRRGLFYEMSQRQLN